MISRAQIIEQINIDLSFDAEIRCACHSIIEYIFSSNRENLKHIAFFKIKTVINTNNDSTVIKTMRYLSGESLPIFDICFEFIDGEYIEQINLDLLISSQSENKFYHPETGELVDNFESKIFMYFSLSNYGFELECN
ncbi:hypothetical protein ID850_16270 [Xenorhabdus sp. Flor]|uniref:hypothetical protein n=1 Tax=Xenorhabdus cabanillasii TaxID=351673 RepID=UPI0019BFEBE3|nr:hypothetical protein [Xenorhabdus sp. Flor]MBD2816265.1 hypothetical protein [Xenorhabdus sp. Flor]